MENFTRLPSTMLDVLMDSKPVLLYPESNLPERYFEARALLPTLLSPTITTVQSRRVGGRIFLRFLSRKLEKKNFSHCALSVARVALLHSCAVFSESFLFPELTVVVWAMVVGSLLSGRGC